MEKLADISLFEKLQTNQGTLSPLSVFNTVNMGDVSQRVQALANKSLDLQEEIYNFNRERDALQESLDAVYFGEDDMDTPISSQEFSKLMKTVGNLELRT